MNIWMAIDKIGYTEVYVIPKFFLFTINTALHQILHQFNIKRVGVTGPDSGELCLWKELRL